MRYEKLIKPLAFASLVHCSEITCSQGKRKIGYNFKIILVGNSLIL